MQYLFAGAGQAGTQIVDRVFERDNIAIRAEPLAFNSTIQDLERLSNVPRDRWYGVSESHGLVKGTAAGFEEQVTGGFGQTPENSHDVMARQTGEVSRVLDDVYDELDADPSTLQYAFVFLGLGGGTGCGIAPHLAQEIREYSPANMDIVAVAVLPNTEMFQQGTADDETISQVRQCRNTVFGLDHLEKKVESILLIDNQRLAYDMAASSEFSDYNQYVADAFLDVVLGAEAERVDVDIDVDMQDVDLQDLIRFIEGDGSTAGYAAIGRGVTMTKSLLGYLLPGGIGRNRVHEASLIADAISKQTLANTRPGQAKNAVGVVRAPGWCWESDEVKLGTVYEELSYYCRDINVGWAATNRNLASVTTVFGYQKDDISRLDKIAEIAEREEVAVSG